MAYPYPNEVPHQLFVEKKVEEIRVLVSDPHLLVVRSDEPLLFQPEFRPALMEYLRHHSLDEFNQHYLMEEENFDVLDFFIRHWVLGARCEARLCTPAYRDKWLMKYLQFHRFADSKHELLLFEDDMQAYRRFYIQKCEFFCIQAEKRLFEDQFLDDLRWYLENKRSLYNENVELLIIRRPELVDVYKKYKA